MNNNRLNRLYVLQVLIPPNPLLLQAKEGGVQCFAPLCEAERGWGEFFRDYFFFKFFFRFFLSYVSFIYLYCYNL